MKKPGKVRLKLTFVLKKKSLVSNCALIILYFLHIANSVIKDISNDFWLLRFT